MSAFMNILILVTFYALIKDAVKIYRSCMIYFLSQTESRSHIVSGIYIRQNVNLSLRGPTKNGENWYMTNNNQFTVY